MNKHFAPDINLGETLRHLVMEKHRQGLNLPLDQIIGTRDTQYTNETIERSQPGPQLRAQNAGAAIDGGFTVETAILECSPAFRQRNLAARLGAQFITVPGGANVPKISTGAVAHWLSETGTCPESTLTFGSLALSPRRLACLVPVSKQLLAQSPAIAGAALKADILAAIGAALDVAVFSGSGGIEPLGLTGADIPAPITFGGPATLADLCNLESALGDEFADNEGCAFVGSVTTRSKLRQIETFSGGGRPLWDGSTVLGYRAAATPALVNHELIFGNFADLLVVNFGGQVRLLFDPYTRAKEFIGEFYAELFCDLGPVRSISFARSTDSAAQ